MAKKDIKHLNLNKTYFNKEAIAKLTFAEFNKLYENRLHKDVDRKKLFKENGGKM